MYSILKNLKFSVLNYIVVNLLKFIVRIVFVRHLSLEYLGINGLFSNILAVLSLAELGVGPAIVYSLYKPLALGDKEAVKSIMKLFKKLYISIGFVIGSLGLCLYPFLDSFIKDKPDIADLNYFYLLFLLNTVVSYFWSYQRNLLIADKKLYFVNAYQAIVQVAVAVAQIIGLVLLESYWCFIVLMLLGTVVENFVIARKAYAEYPYIKEESCELDESVLGEIVKNTKAMVIHKLAGIIVFSSSNIILSKFVGLVAVGLYSNYYMVITVMNTLAGKLFEAITANVGHILVVNDDEKKVQSFKIMEFVTALQVSVMSVGMYVLFNPFITLWLGKEFLFDKATVVCLVVLFYLMFMRKAVLLYRDASGLFWQDRYKAISEMIINLVATIYLVQHYGVLGVVCGGIISTMLTCFWLEPFILFKYSLPMSLNNYFMDYFKYTTVTILCALGLEYVSEVFINGYSLISFILFGSFIVIFVSLVWFGLFRNREEVVFLKKKLLKF
ncbi:MAG: oligosaccharide flippase family protein [Phascolarctobacterium sp.]|nr:oligosaccharide flippase family protein [Phascolarctobacterium sp.]